MEGLLALGLSKIGKQETFAPPPDNNILSSLQDSTLSSIDSLKQDNIYTKLQQQNPAPASSLDRISSILFIIFWVFLGAYCAYLSWTSNDLIGYSNIPKTIFATGAFMFPFYYILMYYIGKYDLILYIKSKRR